MQNNAFLDPKLYQAARTGDINSFRTHAHLNEAEARKFDADPNAKPDESEVSLQQASSQLSRVTSSTKDTVLHVATLFQHTELAKKICRVRQSLLTEVNDKLETPLHYAARSGNQELVKHFIELASQDGNNAEVQLFPRENQRGETALYQAVLHQHQNVVKELMNASVGMAKTSHTEHMSPLYLAITLNSSDIVTYLIRKLPQNASKDVYCGPGGQTALHAAALRNTSFAELLLNWKPELTKDQDDLKRTPLHYAASLNHPELVQMLLEKEEPIESAYKADSDGLYPVHVAAKLGHLEVLMKILNQCPDSEELLDSKGRNFLHVAIEEKRTHVVQFICKQMKFHRALNAQDGDGNTPLHLAVQARSLTMLSSLISSKSVQLNWVNKDGSTALDIAYNQEINNFFLWQNLDSAMYHTLYRIGCVHGPNHLIEESNGQENENRRERNITKSISTIAVLIAAATFAALFAVADVFINNQDSYKTFDLADDFYAFVIFDAGAFVISMLAALLVEGTLNFLNHTDEKVFLRTCANCVMIAAKSFIMAFATGACVILTPLNEDLARHVEFWASVGGILIIFLLQWEGIMLTMAIISKKGVKALFKSVPHAPSKKVSAKLPKFIRILYFITETWILDYVMSAIIAVYLVDLIMEFRIPAFWENSYKIEFQFASTALALVITSVICASKVTTWIVGPFS